MSVKRYYATKDNTITNAYKANLNTRGVSGNMGQSDILEVFSIYGQVSSSSGLSSELARTLIQFDTSQITTDRAAGTIPASGSVNFFLKMYDAEHTQTTPKDFTLVVNAMSQSWQEGLGLDMEDYTDLDESNWLYASDVDIAATASIKIDDITPLPFTLTLSGTNNNYLFTAVASGPGENEWEDGANVNECASNLKDIINESASADFVAAASGLGANYVKVSAVAAGTSGNLNALTSSNTDVLSFDEVSGDNTLLQGGNDYTPWTTEGGDYTTGSDAQPLEYTFTQSFSTGFENLDLDVSHLVEDWISETAPVENNYGFGIQLTSTLEPAIAEESYYTKMFFARDSQYFLKRPVLEARWDSSKKDNRDSFYLSSSLVPAGDNLMKLYLYNIVRGNLTNIPAIGTRDMLVSIYSASQAGVPAGSKLYSPIGGGVVATGDTNITASYVETGIYSCSFAYVSSSITKIIDIWHSGSGGGDSSVQYHTGSAITIKTFDSEDYNFDQNYVSKITNLKDIYSTRETARFRLFVRKKDWSPTIYTVSSNAIETSIIQDAYYQVMRVSDDFKVIPFGTGSLNYTRLSYDASGSYFDLRMNLFDTDTVYEMSFTYLINGNYVEQPEKFRFRVE